MAFQNCFLVSTIDKPAQVRNSSATLIDNVFVNNPEQVNYCGILINDLSEPFGHFSIMYEICKRKTGKLWKTQDNSQFSAKLLYALIMISDKWTGAMFY